jgi:Zn-dependent protease
MRPLTVGRFQAIDVRVHPSIAIVFVWAVYFWGVDGGGMASIAYGLALVGAVFALVLLHEAGHGLMARQLGLRVRDVTLLPFGGIARIEQMPANPRIEALVALAGPLTNVALAILTLPLFALYILIEGTSIPVVISRYSLETPSFGGFFYFLFLANLLLAIVNLAPAFPLDGGRVFRAVMSPFIGRSNATRAAVALGVALALLLGVVALSRGDYILPIVSALLVIAAIAEGRAVRLERQMQRLSVGQFAVWDRGGISPAEPLALALRDGPRDIAVTADGHVLGILWKSDLQYALEHGGISRRAGELMDTEIITADIAASVFDVHRLMAAHDQWALPITENGQYRGIFTADRFSHVYQYLRSRSIESRHMAAFTGSLAHALRGWVR